MLGERMTGRTKSEQCAGDASGREWRLRHYESEPDKGADRTATRQNLKGE